MSTTPLDRWRAGAEPATFTPAEADALAQHLVQTGRSVYTNPKDPQHAVLSAEVAALYKRANPGKLGPGGESA